MSVLNSKVETRSQLWDCLDKMVPSRGKFFDFKEWRKETRLIKIRVYLLIVSWHRYWSHRRELLRCRVPEFGCILRCDIGEWYSIGLPAYHKHLTVG